MTMKNQKRPNESNLVDAVIAEQRVMRPLLDTMYTQRYSPAEQLDIMTKAHAAAREAPSASDGQFILGEARAECRRLVETPGVKQQLYHHEDRLIMILNEPPQLLAAVGLI